MSTALASIWFIPSAGGSAPEAARARGASSSPAAAPRADEISRAKAVRKLQHPVRARKLEGFLDV